MTNPHPESGADSGPPTTPEAAPPVPGARLSPPPPDLPPPLAHERRPSVPPPFPGPWGPPQGPWAPHAPVVPDRRPSPEELQSMVERVRQAQRASSAALIGGLLLQLTSLPWSLASGVLAVVASVYGIRALRLGGRLRHAGVPLRGRAAVGLGVGLASLLLAQSLVQIAIFDVQWDYQTCRGAAQTDTARHACDAEHERRLKP